MLCIYMARSAIRGGGGGVKRGHAKHDHAFFYRLQICASIDWCVFKLLPNALWSLVRKHMQPMFRPTLLILMIVLLMYELYSNDSMQHCRKNQQKTCFSHMVIVCCLHKLLPFLCDHRSIWEANNRQNAIHFLARKLFLLLLWAHRTHYEHTNEA